MSDLNKYNINTDLCIYSNEHDMTVSYIIVSEKTKSRTIINNSCLMSLTYKSFIETINFRQYTNISNSGSNNGNVLLNTIDNTLKYVKNMEVNVC